MSATNMQAVERLLDRLTQQEQLALIEQLARRLRKSEVQKPPQSLYGSWRGKFPDDFDLDAALKLIRGEWEQEWTANRNP